MSNQSKGVFEIRNFGNNRVVDTIEQAEAVLSSDYRGKHVSLQYKDKNGMLTVVFVSVTEQGEVFHTNKEGVKVDFSLVEQARKG